MFPGRKTKGRWCFKYICAKFLFCPSGFTNGLYLLCFPSPAGFIPVVRHTRLKLLPYTAYAKALFTPSGVSCAAILLTMAAMTRYRHVRPTIPGVSEYYGKPPSDTCNCRNLFGDPRLEPIFLIYGLDQSTGPRTTAGCRNLNSSVSVTVNCAALIV